MKKNIISFTIVLGFILAFALPVLANVPAPPVNQTIGIPDTTFDNLTEADCRLCHENPDQFPVKPVTIPNRHHLLYGKPIPPNSVVPDPDADNDGNPDTNYGCLNCHIEDTSGGVIVLQVFRDCLVCHVTVSGAPTVHHATTFAQNGDCVHCHGTLVDNPVGCKELYCAVASSSAGSTRGVPIVPCSTPGTTGTECDTLGLGGGPVKVCGDTTQLCATNADCVGVGTGTCSSAAYCGMYGGEDTCNDGHAIPTYAPSLVTPSRSQHAHVCEGTADSCNYDTDCTEGTCSTTTSQTCHVDLDCPDGETCNGGVECVEAVPTVEVPGGCAYCHNEGSNTVGIAMDVMDNHDTHHGAGVHRRPDGSGSDSTKCAWCHKAGYPHSVYGEEEDHIRWCENCHGYESLHNIAIDSDTGCLFGDPGCAVVIGGEMPGYSHVGNNDDCWGCHGFVQASAPGAGPATPYLLGADTRGATSGYDTMVTLVGATLTNLVGTYQWTSNVTMTGADGSAVTLTPASVTSNQLAVTIPAATAPGNYALRAVKGTYAASNPIVLSVIPDVVISGSSCDRKKGVLTISGSGFGEKPAGTDAYINTKVGGQLVSIASWSDTKITASVSGCSNAAVTVNALMGSATSGGGKADKPCKGNKCN
jgi:hypothetical protein